MKVPITRLWQLLRQAENALSRSARAPEPVRKRLEEDISILQELIARREDEQLENA